MFLYLELRTLNDLKSTRMSYYKYVIKIFIIRFIKYYYQIQGVQEEGQIKRKKQIRKTSIILVTNPEKLENYVKNIIKMNLRKIGRGNVY